MIPILTENNENLVKGLFGLVKSGLLAPKNSFRLERFQKSAIYRNLRSGNIGGFIRGQKSYQISVF